LHHLQELQQKMCALLLASPTRVTTKNVCTLTCIIYKSCNKKCVHSYLHHLQELQQKMCALLLASPTRVTTKNVCTLTCITYKSYNKKCRITS
jgi:hypothetical protein